MPLITRSQILSIVEARLLATKQFDKAMGDDGEHQAAAGTADGGFGMGFDDEADSAAVPTIDPATKAALRVALAPATAAAPNPITIQTINEVVDIFDRVTRGLLVRNEEADQASVEERMAPFAAAGQLRHFIHEEWERDSEKVRLFLVDFLGKIGLRQTDFWHYFQHDLAPGAALDMVTLNRILNLTLGDDPAQRLGRAQAAHAALLTHFPTHADDIPEATPESLNAAGIFRDFLHKNCKGFGEEVKLVAQQLIVYKRSYLSFLQA